MEAHVAQVMQITVDTAASAAPAARQGIQRTAPAGD
jgi:hypothetical protein